MISFQNQEQLGQLFAALQGRYRQPLSLRIVIGVIMLAAGCGAFFLGLMTFLEGNVHLSRAYEILVFVIMTLLAALAFYYAYYMNLIVYEFEENRLRAFLLPDHLRWEISQENVDHAKFTSSPNGEQLEIHCTNGRVLRVLCTSEMRRIIEAVHQNILSQQPPIPVAFDSRKKLRLAIFGVLLLAAPVLLLFLQYRMQAEQERQVEDQTASATNTSVEVTFSDSAGYTVPIPEGWRLIDHTKRDQLIRADITKGKDAGVQVRLQKCSPDAFVEMEKALSHQYKLDMSKHWGGDCVEIETTTLRKGALTRRFQLDRKDGQRW